MPGVGGAQQASAAGPSFRFVDIPVAPGVALKANVYVPAGADAAHPAPVVVMPASWSMPTLEYVVPARQLAESGYIALSYTARGFWLSGGEIGVAGPDDVADISRVIDWALANTPADASRIGMAGVSYGAGLGLLGAAHDPRIKAVAALSGWADLVDSIYMGQTQHVQSAAGLAVAGYLTGRPSSEFSQFLVDFLTTANVPELIAWANVRSPATYVDRLNANGAAVMLANAWGDSIFPPNQLAEFYGRLTVPKRLEFRPGDHATPEIPGLAGLPNDTWANTRAWLDRYLKGTDNGIDRQPPVQIKPRLEGGYEGYADWADLTGSRLDLRLGDNGWSRTGPLAPDAGTGWSTRIGTNVDSGANGGIIFLTNLVEEYLRIPPTVSVPMLPRAVAAVWQSDRLAAESQVRGTANLHVTVTPTASQGTFIAYLYDVDALGVGRLVTHAPYTFFGKQAWRPFAADVELLATAYDVPAGHRLALVVDTVDLLYLEQNPALSSLAFGSPAADPSWISVPLR
ncbi:acyl esterase [Yinghuangia sp. KLBMP8922]|uniref:Acyl esterase n=1 Tax=Yinghuangia soli TaxID=2908204 RepID=A0AA41U8E6_9ACTN|nr:CocE/NonD family hydrolase [Yinghuangia soli]MCF2532829.1 acyl esterase [Yinghuangia soli]